MENLGDLIRTQRMRQKMTQAELGRAVGVDPAMISRYENGITVPPRRKLMAIASHLDIDITPYVEQNLPTAEKVKRFIPTVKTVSYIVSAARIADELKQQGAISFELDTTVSKCIVELLSDDTCFANRGTFESAAKRYFTKKLSGQSVFLVIDNDSCGNGEQDVVGCFDTPDKAVGEILRLEKKTGSSSQYRLIEAKRQ